MPRYPLGSRKAADGQRSHSSDESRSIPGCPYPGLNSSRPSLRYRPDGGLQRSLARPIAHASPRTKHNAAHGPPSQWKGDAPERTRPYQNPFDKKGLPTTPRTYGQKPRPVPTPRRANENRNATPRKRIPTEPIHLTTPRNRLRHSIPPIPDDDHRPTAIGFARCMNALSAT